MPEDPEERPTPDPHQTLLSPAEAAARLGITPSLLRRWAESGRIPIAVTPGAHRRYLLSDVEWLRQEVESSRHRRGGPSS